jgi:hypothetical protein
MSSNNSNPEAEIRWASTGSTGPRPFSDRVAKASKKKIAVEVEAQRKAEEEEAETAARKEARKKKAAETKAKNGKGTNSDTTPDTTPPKRRQDKKRKSSDEDEDEPETPPKRGRGRPKKDTTQATTKSTPKKAIATSTPVDIDYNRIIDSITTNITNGLTGQINRAVASAVGSQFRGFTHFEFATQVKRSVQTMMLPGLDLVQPFMEYALACGGLNGNKEESAKMVGTRVHDAIERLKEDWKEAVQSPVFVEQRMDEEEFEADDSPVRTE